MIVGYYISIFTDYHSGAASYSFTLLRSASLRETEEIVKYRIRRLLHGLS